ncbi:hypothetical protein [Staphylococcus cohnii]|uniref:hypothetical protein n=1 Tax=Staphylococcus cohnii TaxID=29382 RepID=UPI003D7D361A
MENLYVVIDEFNGVNGIYEEDELQELVKYYSEELANEIQSNYTIQEQFDYHFEILGKMSKYYDCLTISENEIANFLSLYNLIAQGNLRYEIIQVVDEVEIQEFIKFVNETENGYQKFKNNNYQIPIQTIIVKHPEDEQNSEVFIKEVNKIDEIIECIITKELKRLRNINTEDILDTKYSYLLELLDIYDKLIKENFTNQPSYDLLYELKEVFEYEYTFIGIEMEIEYSNKSVKEIQGSENVKTFEHVIRK